jgi:hypothetical protein
VPQSGQLVGRNSGESLGTLITRAVVEILHGHGAGGFQYVYLASVSQFDERFVPECSGPVALPSNAISTTMLGTGIIDLNCVAGATGSL